MSSGRDEMMANWSQEQRESFYKPKSQLDRLKDYLEVLEEAVERTKYQIKELQNAE